MEPAGDLTEQEEREERARLLHAELAVEEAMQDRELAWELARLERAALEDVTDDEEREEALVSARAGWHIRREQRRAEQELEAQIEAALEHKLKAAKVRQAARDREEGRRLYGRGVGVLGGGGGARVPSPRQKPEPPSVGDRLRAGERVPAAELDRFVQERLAQASEGVRDYIQDGWEPLTRRG